jgi:hypothetical protein
MAPHRQKSAVLLPPSPAYAQVAEASPLARGRLCQFSSIVCGVAWSETLPQRDCSVALLCKHRSAWLHLFAVADRLIVGPCPRRSVRNLAGDHPAPLLRSASSPSVVSAEPNSTPPCQHRQGCCSIGVAHTGPLPTPFAAGIRVTGTAAPGPQAQREADMHHDHQADRLR